VIGEGARGRGLWLLFGLFILRVVGQIVVGVFAPAWLPPWDQWQSGLLPYPVLLIAQLVLVAWMWRLCLDNTSRTGRFTVRSERVRRGLRMFAAIYAASMLFRYVATQSLTDAAWWHDTIPVVFHLVLAGYVGLLGARPLRGARE
jgi:hypothetical protein